MRMLLVVSDAHDPLGRGVVCMSSGIDGGLWVFVPSVIRSSTLYQHAGIPLHRASNSSRVQGGCLSTGEAFDPGPRDELSIGLKHVGDVCKAEFCEAF